MEHDPAEAGETASAAGGQQHVGVGPAAVQAEQIHHAQGVPVILLAHHVAVHAENALKQRRRFWSFPIRLLRSIT